MANSRLQELLTRYLQDEIKPEELPVLQQLIKEETNNDELDQWLQTAYANPSLALDSDFDREQLFADLQKRLSGTETLRPVVEIPPSKSRMIYRRVAAAAAIIIIVGLGSYFAFFQHNQSDPSKEVASNQPATDIKAPATNKAMITLADGKTVLLDSLTNGLLAQQGNVKLVKLDDGKIAYQTETGEIITELKYNTLSNPRGSKVIDMMLSDGSHVWLNAGSSVTYPVAFVGSDRKVSITGEAYFEVAHDAAKPFYVSKGDMEVKVLGTHFNVNAYENEKDIRVTLLEGSVSVASRGNTALIKPGQQSVVANNNIAINNKVDLDQVMAWKNGLFVFDGYDNIQAIMRQLERWYDVKVQYNGNVNTLFGGSVPRSANVSSVLKMLETTGTVNFKVEEGVITVTPVK